MSERDLNKALDALADYADLVWDATDMQDKDTMAIARTQQELFCPEPRRCDCTCHIVAETPPLRLGGRLAAARRVWGRWT